MMDVDRVLHCGGFKIKKGIPVR
uniref:Uncharacterized protein n=1 Tax=Lepeophtheirus salmonis TaxID=72036 RepID=A0A0K2UYB0_LEPSM